MPSPYTKVNYSKKPCIECGQEFKPRSSVHVYCSPECKGKHPYTTGVVTTDSQYLKISNNWYKYFQRLTYKAGREDITVDMLVSIAEAQSYRCALSGEPMTCVLGRGVVSFTNASIDRIIPGGPYTRENIRLVCRIANTMKWNLTDEELKFWCERIAQYA